MTLVTDPTTTDALPATTNFSTNDYTETTTGARMAVTTTQRQEVISEESPELSTRVFTATSDYSTSDYGEAITGTGNGVAIVVTAEAVIVISVGVALISQGAYYIK